MLENPRARLQRVNNSTQLGALERSNSAAEFRILDAGDLGLNNRCYRGSYVTP